MEEKEKNDRFVVVFLNKGLTFFANVRSDEASKKNDAPTQLKDGPVLIIFCLMKEVHQED